MGRVARQIKRRWNLFQDAPQERGYSGGMSLPPNRNRGGYGRGFNDKSHIWSIYNRMAIDGSSVELIHVETDENGVAIKLAKDSLHERLTLDPNIDQNAQALKHDYVMTLFEHGYAAIIPIEADMDPLDGDSYDIGQLRVGTIVGWFPRHVLVEVYDDREVDSDGQPVNGGVSKQIKWPKDKCVIVENPFLTVMNTPNGLLQRLIRKLAILDGIDEAAGSGKLDLIFQLPYTVRGESRTSQAEKRREALREQLMDDELGIGYIDISEKVIQLNRPIENKLLDQIELLFKTVRSELGITEEIMNGSADTDQINNYYDRTIEPLMNTLALEIKRKFLTKNARTRGHSIEIYRDPLKLIPLSELAEIVDKLRRAGVVSANELRPKIGFMPSTQPGANELKNPNMPDDDQGLGGKPPPTEEVTGEEPPEGGGE